MRVAMTADDLPEISSPALAALHAAGIRTLDDMAHYTERELLQMHGVGPKAIRLLRPALAACGLDFRRPTNRKTTDGQPGE